MKSPLVLLDGRVFYIGIIQGGTPGEGSPLDPLLRFIKHKGDSALCGARARALPLHPAAFEKAGETFRRASRSEVNKIARGGVPAPFAVRGLCGLLCLDYIRAAGDAAEEVFALGVGLGGRDETLDARGALAGDGVEAHEAAGDRRAV